jgi:DNA-binding IclR family transcriptional regulator
MESPAHALVLVIIDAARASGLSTHEIARRTGIPQRTVHDLLRTNQNSRPAPSSSSLKRWGPS